MDEKEEDDHRGCQPTGRLITVATIEDLPEQKTHGSHEEREKQVNQEIDEDSLDKQVYIE